MLGRPSVVAPTWVSSLSFKCQQERLLERRHDPAPDARRVGSVNQPVIESQRQRQHQARLKTAAVINRLIICPRHSQYSDFRRIDDGRETGAANAAEISD